MCAHPFSGVDRYRSVKGCGAQAWSSEYTSGDPHRSYTHAFVVMHSFRRGVDFL
jgi:hypothetical protein